MTDNIEEEDVVIIYTDDDYLWNAVNGIKSEDWEDDPFKQDEKFHRSLDGLSMGSKRMLTNRINKKEQGIERAGTKGVHREQLTGYGLWDVVEPIYNLEHLALLMEKSSVHSSAVKAKVSSSVTTGFDLVESELTVERMEDADESQLDAIRSTVTNVRRKYIKWLDDVNKEDTFTDILEKWVTDFESLGVGALEIGRTSTGQIGYIGHIPAHTLRPRKDRDGYVQIVDKNITFFRNFGDRETADPIGNDPEPNEIIYIKKYTPRSTYYGVPDIIPALTAVAGIEFANQYNVDYFENKAVPRHLIVVKGTSLSGPAEKKLINFFQTNVKGKHHRAVYVPLGEQAGPDAEIQIQAVEANIQDASFSSYIEMNRDEVLMSHRVPAGKIGLSREGISLAVARDADRTFKETVSNPLQRKIETLVNYILSERTNIVKFVLNELSLVDEETQSIIDETYVRIGADSINEVRARRGQKAVEGGDERTNAMIKDPQQQAEQRSQATNGRRREQEESRSGPDAENSGQGREPKS